MNTLNLLASLGQDGAGTLLVACGLRASARLRNQAPASWPYTAPQGNDQDLYCFASVFVSK